MKCALATLAVVASLSLPAAADTIYSNFGPSQSYDPNFGYNIQNDSDGFQGVAVSFTPTAAYVGSTFTIALFPFASGDVTVDLVGDLNGLPGSQLSSTQFTVDNSGLFSGSFGPLAANTTYWLVVLPVSDGMFVVWNANSTGDTTPFAFSLDGSTWISSCCSSASPAFEIDGTPAQVPEPGTVTLLGLGIAAFAAKLRKKS
jgi:hypothetical protein